MVKNLFLKIRNIIVGNWRNLTGYQSDEMKRRLDICKSCSHNIKFSRTRICDQCGCILTSKASIESEKCLMNKW
jgi:hypothetical protein